MHFILNLFLLLLPVSSFCQSQQEQLKDTILLTCYNNDSLAMVGFDSTKFYIDKVSFPTIELTTSNELSCENQVATLSVLINEPLENLSLWLTTPSGDTLYLKDSLEIRVQQAGMYTVHTMDIENGCTTIDSKEVSAAENFDYCNIGYTPLVVENATWLLYNGEEDFTINTYFAYRLEGDTVVHDTLYKKLYFFELQETADTNFLILNQKLIGAFREDVFNKKVYGRFFDTAFSIENYFLCGNSNQEIVVFDFNKTVGDELKDCHIFLTEEPIAIVTDTILERYGQYRRVLTTDSGIALIEGIGYGTGLFLPPTGFTHAGFGYGIIDYCLDNIQECKLLIDTFAVDLDDYFPIGATWHYGHEIIGQRVIKSFFTTEVIGDTLIDGQSAKQLLISDINKPYHQNDEIIIRQIGRRVEYLQRDSFYLLYDFGATIGDTVSIDFPIDLAPHFTGPTTIKYRVDSISTILINEEMRQMQHLRYLTEEGFLTKYGPQIVEGIGSLTGWLLPYQECHTCSGEFDFITGLRCYENEQLGLWQYREEACDLDIIVSTQEVFPFAVQVFPNPTNDFLHVNFETNFNGQVRLLNTAGIAVYQKSLTTATHAMDIQNLSSGVYFLHLYAKEGHLIEKVVIQ